MYSLGSSGYSGGGGGWYGSTAACNERITTAQDSSYLDQPCDGTGPGGRGCSWEVGGPRGGPGGRRQGEGEGGGGQAGGGHGREWSLESQTVNLAGVSGVQVLSLELPTNKGTKS